MSLLQGQSKALFLATTAVESCLSELIDLVWQASPHSLETRFNE